MPSPSIVSGVANLGFTVNLLRHLNELICGIIFRLRWAGGQSFHIWNNGGGGLILTFQNFILLERCRNLILVERYVYFQNLTPQPHKI